jgi:hypothetical protein
MHKLAHWPVILVKGIENINYVLIKFKTMIENILNKQMLRWMCCQKESPSHMGGHEIMKWGASVPFGLPSVLDWVSSREISSLINN